MARKMEMGIEGKRRHSSHTTRFPNWEGALHSITGSTSPAVLMEQVQDAHWTYITLKITIKNWIKNLLPTSGLGLVCV